MKYMKYKYCLISIILVFLSSFAIHAGDSDLKLTSPDNEKVFSSLPIKFTWQESSDKKVYQLKIWGSDNKSFFSTLSEDNNFTLKDLNITPGTYTWSVRTMGFLNIFPSSDFTEKRTFLIQGTPEKESAQFKVTGKTLIIPCEFSDITYANTKTNTDFMFPAPQESANQTLADQEAVHALIRKKLDEMRRFLKICSQDAPEADLESSYDITPIFSAPNPREYYGKDFEGEKNGNKFINNDTGTESEDKYYGNRLLKKQALEKLIKEYNIPVNKYNHLIYVVPGNKENPPSDQLYPCSYSGKPWNIKVISGTDTLTGSLHCGIMQPLGAQVGTFAHEFGHQLGLPDLYPYSNIPNRDLGYSGLMASGSHYNTSFTGMSKLKKYDESYFKKNWLEESRIIYAEKEGTYTLHARDSKNSPNMIYINLSNTFEPNDCFIIEVFDRQDIDKNTAAYLSGNQGTGKANAGVFIYYMDDIDVEDIKFLNTLPASEKAWNRVFLPGGEYSDYGVTISVESLTLNNEHYTANIKISFTEKAEKGKSSSISDSDYDKGSNNFKADNKTSNEKAELIKKKIDISRLDLSGRLKKSLDQMIKGVAIIIRKGKEKISDIKTKEK